MTGAEIARRDTIPAKIQYAKALAESGLLPSAYRKQPANILWAVEYGEMLGLPSMAAITGVHVIEGKPAASAGLISALVRRAGHKLRITGDARSATCQIIRADDPGYTFEVTFTIEDAKTAGLTTKDVWKKYAASMLKSRAITQCARDACEEVLFGLHYTPEELGAEIDDDQVVAEGMIDLDEAVPEGNAATGAVNGQVAAQERAPELAEPAEDQPGSISDSQMRGIQARFRGILTREDLEQRYELAYAERFTQRPLDGPAKDHRSLANLSYAEAALLKDELRGKTRDDLVDGLLDDAGAS